MKKAGIYLLLLILFCFPLSAQDQLPRSSPEDEGVDPSAIAEFLEAVEESSHEFHSLMILRNGKVITESWWGPYGADLKHTMYSVSKSFTATAIGFAVDEKRLSLEDKVISFFPDKLPDSVSPHLQALSIQNLLTMSVGHGQDPTGKVVSSDNWAEAFLNVPIPNPPGSKFLYNTAATYMLSAILQKVTGETLLDYLTPRLFRPLGISDVDWESDPHGINTGGYGLRLKTEDMAKFGQLFLQKGQWQGKQVLPVEWVEEASSVKIIQDPDAPKEKVNQSDWLQGYGYQMWRSRHNSFRADGAFGQYILVLPELNAVIAITSETKDMQGLLDLVWEYLLPAFDQGNLSEDPKLASALANLARDPLVSEPNQVKELEVDGQWFERENKSFMVDFRDGITVLNLKTGEKHFQFSFGSGKWVLGETDRKGPYLVAGAKGYLSGLEPFKVAGSYAWSDELTLELQVRYIESPHTQIIRLIFDQHSAVMEIGNSFQQHTTELIFEVPVHEEL
jgi:CubicO group peptidase (beta-lactamase class C family)